MILVIMYIDDTQLDDPLQKHFLDLPIILELLILIMWTAHNQLN